MLLEQQRKKIIYTAKKSQEMGLIPLTFGNFSLRDKETGYICITPSGMDYQELKPEDIVVVDADCNVIDGERKFSIETPMHCMVFRNRPDVNGICHTHSVFATAWASTNNCLPAVVAELVALVGGTVDTAPYRPMGSVELAEVVTETLKDKYAVLMANHGLLAVGPDIETAFVNSVIVEEGAKTTYYASNIGKVNIIPEEDCKMLRQWVIEKYGQK
ncbi:MAG: class II aldolase/adducin family protein [Clostridia bacterium]|nr:class II aldolase/adducin family protein [Clostridia bacterium]MDD4048958.1 class II aldolase/adducin family protein [Clostridia bacterium]